MPAAATGRELTGRRVHHFLALLRRCRAARHLKQAHALLCTGGISQDLLCTTQFLLCCIRLLPGHGYPLLVLRRLEAPSASSWTAAMRECLTSSRHEETVALFVEMLREGVTLDRHVYPLLLKAIAKSNGKDPAQIHAQVVKFGWDSDSFVQNSLVSCYATAGHLGRAAKLFDRISHKDSISWTSMIHGYVKNNMGAEGLGLFLEMRLSGIKVDEVTIVSVLSGCGILGCSWFGRCIHGFYVECGRVKRDVFVGCALVDMYARCGCIDEAHKVFDEMPYRNVVSWTALITGYIQCSRFTTALAVFHDMFMEGFLPNEATLSGVLAACSQLGALEHGRSVHGYINKHDLGLNAVTGTAMIDMYAKCGCINQARAIFKRLPQKDVHPWTAMINGLAMHGYTMECLDVFSCMLEERVQPNEVTFLSILSACSHCGFINLGRRYFSDMSRVFGIKPKLAHYGCMVDLLGRVGLLDEALHLINSMPMDPSPGVWGALFSACMIHKNYELGGSIGEHLIKLQPHHSGRYALLANMYLEAQKWEKAASIRMLMKGRGVEKMPGCSWIEVNGVVHDFFSTDWSHPQLKDVYQMLDCMGLHQVASRPYDQCGYWIN
uniref:Pentatricopeptide repeat-containing protein At1g50270 n=1 Tax=Anthurium amnicola TaxID=1678845 RepID=A0A1D1Z3D0_9ARAE